MIVGHSERRTCHKETDAEVRAKALAAWRAGLTAIVCVGETRAEREAGQTLDVLGRQLDGSLPDGATARQSGDRLRAGLGDRHRADADRRPTSREVHDFIRKRLAERHGARGERGAHPLWRLGQAVECQGD